MQIWLTITEINKSRYNIIQRVYSPKMVKIESLLTELCALQVIVHDLGTVRVGLSLSAARARGVVISMT